MDSEPRFTDEPALAGATPASGGTSRQLRAAAQNQTSRRAMLRRGSVVAASVAALTLLEQRRAEAANGDNFVLGTSNNANSPTTLVPSTNGDAPGAGNPWFRINGSALAGTSTTMQVDGPGGPAGVGLVVSGNAGGTGLVATAGSTAHTVGLALAASCSGGDAIHASSDHGAGVAASSSTGPGVKGSGARGGVFAGKSANVNLTPHKVGHPRAGLAGDLFVDNHHHLWFCHGGTTWSKLT